MGRTGSATALRDAFARIARNAARRIAGPPKLVFRVRIEPDHIDGGYVAECIDLPGCMSQGETEQEALENLIDAIDGVVAVRMQRHLERHEFEELHPQRPPRELAIPVP